MAYTAPFGSWGGTFSRASLEWAEDSGKTMQPGREKAMILLYALCLSGFDPNVLKAPVV